MTLEQRIKLALGELLLANLRLTQQLEEALEMVGKNEPPNSGDDG